MFENLRDAFREAIENFNKELERDRVPESVDKLLAGMHDEVTDARARIEELRDQIERAEAEAERQKVAAETARRREELAQKIEDAETVRVAEEFAGKHEERHRLLEKKVVALREELVFLEREYDGMVVKLKDAKAKRDAVAATAGRTQTRESMGAADDLFAELDRMAAKIGDDEAAAEAAEAFDEYDLHVDVDAPPERPEVDVDARLAELKRRMGKE